MIFVRFCGVSDDDEDVGGRERRLSDLERLDDGFLCVSSSDGNE